MKPESQSKPKSQTKSKTVSKKILPPRSENIPKDSTKKLLAITLGTIISLLAIGTIVVAVLSSIKVDPTNRFYSALEKSMSLSYVHQKYTTAGSYYGSNVKMVADSYTDFSDVKAPKTKAHLTVDVADKTVEDVDVVASKNYANYVKINKFGDGMDGNASTADKNTWYTMDSASQAETIDMFQSTSSINQTFGEVLSGNYTASDRAALLKMYKDEKGFTFDPQKDVKETTINGEKVSVYTVKMAATAIKAVNDEAAKRLGISGTEYHFTDKSMTIAISAKTGKFVQVSLTQSSLTTTIDIDYPTSLEISVPKDTKPFSSINATKLQRSSNSY